MLVAAFAIGSCEKTVERSAPPATKGSAAAAIEGTFEGSWNAAGTRHTIPLGGGAGESSRTGSTIDLRGTMLLTGAGRPGLGFRAEVIALTDTQTGLVGRGVWTDERGDRVFSELKGEGTKERNRITGTFLGGTGRYSGMTGTYEFSWEYVIESEDGSIQGRSTGLKGQYRLTQQAPGVSSGSGVKQ